MTTGLVACVGGAVSSVRRVLRAQIALLMRGIEPERSRRAPWLFGAVLMLVALGLSFVSWMPTLVFSVVAAIAGGALLAPQALLLVSKVLVGKPWPVSVSALTVRRNPGAKAIVSVFTILIALGFGLTFAVAGIRASMTTQVERQFGADIQVSSRVANKGVIRQLLEGLPGVKRISGMTDDTVKLSTSSGAGRTVSALVVDPESYFQTAQLPWVEGDDLRTPQDMVRFNGVAVPEGLASPLGIRVGDRVVLERAQGRLELPVVATFSSLATGTQIVVPAAVGPELGFSGESSWNIQLEPGRDLNAFAAEVRGVLKGFPGVKISTSTAMRNSAAAQLATYSLAPVGMTALVVALGAVAVSGLFLIDANSHRFTYGVIRSYGGSAGRIRGLVFCEAMRYGVASLLTGCVSGVVVGIALTRILALALGASVSFGVPGIELLAVCLVTMSAVALAAVPASRQAGRALPAELMKVEYVR